MSVTDYICIPEDGTHILKKAIIDPRFLVYFNELDNKRFRTEINDQKEHSNPWLCKSSYNRSGIPDHSMEIRYDGVQNVRNPFTGELCLLHIYIMRDVPDSVNIKKIIKAAILKGNFRGIQTMKLSMGHVYTQSKIEELGISDIHHDVVVNTFDIIPDMSDTLYIISDPIHNKLDGSTGRLVLYFTVEYSCSGTEQNNVLMQSITPGDIMPSY
jgi:hypothetical protein